MTLRPEPHGLPNRAELTPPSDARAYPAATRLRADARRNLQQILVAARELIVEVGPDVPFDEVARRARVGIATLYRRFPDRTALLRAVAIDVLSRIAADAGQALAEEPDAMQALERYMHRALELRIAAVMPSLVSEIPWEDDTLARLREQAAAPVEAMIRRAQSAGLLRSDVTFGDIGLMLIRLSRPLPGAFPCADDSLAHRHLDIVLDGLRALRPTTPTPSPARRSPCPRCKTSTPRPSRDPAACSKRTGRSVRPAYAGCGALPANRGCRNRLQADRRSRCSRRRPSPAPARSPPNLR